MQVKQIEFWQSLCSNQPAIQPSFKTENLKTGNVKAFGEQFLITTKHETSIIIPSVTKNDWMIIWNISHNPQIALLLSLKARDLTILYWNYTTSRSGAIQWLGFGALHNFAHLGTMLGVVSTSMHIHWRMLASLVIHLKWSIIDRNQSTVSHHLHLFQCIHSNIISALSLSQGSLYVLTIFDHINRFVRATLITSITGI